jgi:hypothetical protein
MNHHKSYLAAYQERSATLPYYPGARLCPRCQSFRGDSCRCPVGDRTCSDCGFQWRTGKLYWLPDDQQPGPAGPPPPDESFLLHQVNLLKKRGYTLEQVTRAFLA